MLTVYKDGGIERFDDLHIDKIDENWRRASLWIEAGLEAFRIALSLRDTHRLPVDVGLAFSLNAVSRKTGIDFSMKEEFVERLDWSPPSLYLLRPGNEFELETESAIKGGHVGDASVEPLNLKFLAEAWPGSRCVYMEFRRKEELEYCRSVWLRA